MISSNRKDWALQSAETNPQTTLTWFLRYTSILALEQYFYIYLVWLREKPKQQLVLYHKTQDNRLNLTSSVF